MAHFAQLDDHNVVINIIKVDDACCLDGNGKECESVGVDFCRSLYGEGTRWIQTSINNRIRKNFATRDSYYDPSLDAFIPKKFFPSWSLNSDTCQWEPPVARPETDEWVIWVEPEQRWVTAQDLVGIDANAPDSIYHERPSS